MEILVIVVKVLGTILLEPVLVRVPVLVRIIFIHIAVEVVILKQW